MKFNVKKFSKISRKKSQKLFEKNQKKFQKLFGKILIQTNLKLFLKFSNTLIIFMPRIHIFRYLKFCPTIKVRFLLSLLENLLFTKSLFSTNFIFLDNFLYKNIILNLLQKNYLITQITR